MAKRAASKPVPPPPKPRPPSRGVLDREARALASLRALGVGAEEAERLTVKPSDRVLVALRDLWRELRRQPTLDEVYDRARLAEDGVKLDSLVTGIYPRLLRDGRIDIPRKGVYVPVVEERTPTK